MYMLMYKLMYMPYSADHCALTISYNVANQCDIEAF